MSEVAPLELFAPEDSLAGNEALPTLFDSIADETKKTQADAPEPEPAAKIDDGLSEDEDEPRLLTRAQKKSGKVRIARVDSKADDNYSPRAPSSKGGKKKGMGKRGSKNLPKPVIARKPVPTIIPVKEVPFLYDRILAALPHVDKLYYDSFAIQNLTICSILEVEKYAHEADPEEALFKDLVNTVLEDVSNKYKLTTRQKNGRVDASWTKTDIGRDPMEVLSRYNELMTGDEEKAKRSYRAHNPERKDWTAADLKRFREAFLKYGAGPTSNKKIAQFMGIHPNQIAYIKQRIRRLARQREIETEFDRAAFEMVKDMKNVPDKVLFKHLRDKLIREDEEDKANKAAARKAKKNAPSTLNDGEDEQQIEDENTNMGGESEISTKENAEDPAGSAENETPANNTSPDEQTNGHEIIEGPNEEAPRETAVPPTKPLASPEPAADISPTSRQRKRTKPQSSEKQPKRRKTEHTPPKSASAPATEVFNSPVSTVDTMPSPLASPTMTSAKSKALTEREQRLLKRKQSSGKNDDDVNGAEEVVLPLPARKKRKSGDSAKLAPPTEVSKSGDEEPIIADTTPSQAPEPISSTDTNGPRSPSEPVTPREVNAEVRARESVAPPRDYSTTEMPSNSSSQYTPMMSSQHPMPVARSASPPRMARTHHENDIDGPSIMSRYATPHSHSQTAKPVTTNPSSQYASMISNQHQMSVARPASQNQTQSMRPASPSFENTSSIPMLLSDTSSNPMKASQWMPEPMTSSTPMQFNYSSTPAYQIGPSSYQTPNPSNLPITPHVPATLMRTNPTPANRSIPIVPQRNVPHNNIPLGTPLTSFSMTGYTNYQHPTPNYLPAMQLTPQNNQANYSNYSTGPNNAYTPAQPKQQQYPMMASPRDFEAAFTPFLINSPDFSAMNANQSAQQFTGPYSMLGYSTQQQQSRQYELPKAPKPTTFVPYVNNNAK